MRLNGRENYPLGEEYNSEPEGTVWTLNSGEKDGSTVRREPSKAGLEGSGTGRHGKTGADSVTGETDQGASLLTHGEKLPRIDSKLGYIEKEKPKWYQADEQTLSVYERHLDDQIKKIDRQKPPSKESKRRFELPKGISAAEHGR